MSYIHRVQYYETDKMGVTHHSNYIRFMEEARVAFMDDVGYSYAKMEEMGVGSPVIGVQCSYKKTTTFNDEIAVEVGIKEYKGSRLTVSYVMTNAATGDVVLTGETTHCFMTPSGHFARLHRDCPEFDAALKQLCEGKEQ